MKNTGNVKKIILVILMGLACFFFNFAQCFRISQENNTWEGGLAAMRPNDSVLEPEFHDDLSAGPEKLAIEVLELVKNEVDEEEERKEKLPESDLDEETIRKAEKMADKDLLNGLNRIFKNNETLKEVFKAENVYEIF